jgi:hypothetical protein
MNASFITIAEAVQLTGKSRRTIQRLVEALTNSQPDLVMKEKTPRGYIWKVSEQAVRQAHGVAGASVGTVSPASQQPAPAPTIPLLQVEKYIEVAVQMHKGMMAMHLEVKQVYEERIKDKDLQIAKLTQELEQARRGFWGRFFAR